MSSPSGSWPTSSWSSPVRPARSSTNRSRSTTPPSGSPTSPWPRSCSAGSRPFRCGKDCSAPSPGSRRCSRSKVPDAHIGEYKLLTVIVPVYNERNTVLEILRRMRLVELPVDREIIVVDDGSTDGTDKVLGAVEDSTVRMLRHPHNQGKGAAIRTGLAAARGDLVLIQDADLEYDPNDWPRLLEPVLLGKAKVAYGTRFSLSSRDSVRRRLGSSALSLLTAALYRERVSDVETCYKLIDREVLESLDLQADRFDVEPEVTAKLLKGQHHIYEVPISYRRRRLAEGRKFVWNDGLRAAWTLVRLRFTGG